MRKEIDCFIDGFVKEGSWGEKLILLTALASAGSGVDLASFLAAAEKNSCRDCRFSFSIMFTRIEFHCEAHENDIVSCLGFLGLTFQLTDNKTRPPPSFAFENVDLFI